MCIVNALPYYKLVLIILFLRSSQKLFFLAVAYLEKKPTVTWLTAHRISHLKHKSMEYAPCVTFPHLQFKGQKDIMQSGTYR